jgi:predicted Zn-dependent peptidase
LGAKLETDVTPDMSFVATQVLKRNAAADFDLVSDTVLHPLFSDKDIERLRNQRQASLRRSKTIPSHWRSASRCVPFTEPTIRTDTLS